MQLYVVCMYALMWVHVLAVLPVVERESQVNEHRTHTQEEVDRVKSDTTCKAAANNCVYHRMYAEKCTTVPA